MCVIFKDRWRNKWRTREYANISNFTSDDYAYRFLKDGLRHTVFKFGVRVELHSSDPSN